MEIYAPLAQRMGILRVRDELEDLSFKILNEEARNMIVNRIKEINPNTLKTFKEISSEIEILLSKSNIKSKVTGREKTPFSIWRKINEKRISLEKITDLIGFRIIAENIDDCYKSLGIFSSRVESCTRKI